MMDRQDEAPQGRRSRKKLIIIFCCISVMAGSLFGYKLYEFFQDLTDDAGIHFAGPHLVTYTLVALGFILLLAFAFLSGHFSQIERPKYEMLEREKDYDRNELAGS